MNSLISFMVGIAAVSPSFVHVKAPHMLAIFKAFLRILLLAIGDISFTDLMSCSAFSKEPMNPATKASPAPTGSIDVTLMLLSVSIFSPSKRTAPDSP